MIRLCVLVVMLLVAPSAPGQTLQFKDGAVLIGEVQQADEDGLTFRRLDNGGVLELRWNHLSSECAGRIKRSFGLSIGEDDEVMWPAHEITYEIGGVVTTYLGVIERTPTDLIVRRRGSQLVVPILNLINVRQVDVPITQVLTREEIYSSVLAELAPGNDPDRHVAVAERLMRVRDYDNAEAHLQQARRIGGSRQPRVIEERLRSLARYREAREEADLLHQIGVRRSRRDFAQGLELIARFEREYPDSSLRVEFERERRRFEAARTRYLAGEVSQQWKKLIRSTAERKVAERDLTLAAARDYAVTGMGEDIATRVAEMLELDVPEVRALWQRRTGYPGMARPESFSYGLGSWVLGQSAIMKDTDREESQDEPGDSREDRQIERFARRIRQARERAGRIQGARGGGEPNDTEEDWWDQADRNERVGWLRAYYAEFGGDLVMHRAHARPCVNCAGSGTVEQLAPSGQSVRVMCQVCHGTRFFRTFRAY